jgi:putative addiction module component (TIGR02574 family)
MIPALYAQICSRQRRFPLRVHEVEVVPGVISAARTRAQSCFAIGFSTSWRRVSSACTLRAMGPAKKHVDELLKLPADERSEAAEALLVSLEQDAEADEAAVEHAWAAEIERRVAENAPGVPAETVLAEGRARLQKRS